MTTKIDMTRLGDSMNFLPPRKYVSNNYAEN